MKIIITIIILGGIIVGIAMAATPEPNRLDKISAILNTIQIGEINKTMAYTDENEGEDFIIKTDSKDYYSWGGGIIVYFSITNVSEINQDANVVFSLGKDQFIRSVKRFAGNIIASETILATATTTEQIVDKQVAQWDNIDFNTKFKISDSLLIRKDMKGRKPDKVFKDNFVVGETKYYKAVMRVPYGITEHEWFIEVFGNSYGHLDPNNWTLENKFNSDTCNIGDLHNNAGCSGWSGAVDFDVTTDAAAVMEGDQGVKIFEPAGAKNIEQILPTSIDSGVFYISIKKTDNTDNIYPTIILKNDADLPEINIFFWSDATIRYYSRIATANIQIDSLTYGSNTETRLGICFRGSGGSNPAIDGCSLSSDRIFKVSIDGGDTWSSELEFETTIGIDINYLKLTGYASSGKYNYFDYISPVYSEVIVNTCTYSGSGDWEILYSDNCYITSDVYIFGAFSLINDGVGSFGTEVNISATKFNIAIGTRINCKKGINCFSGH